MPLLAPVTSAIGSSAIPPSHDVADFARRLDPGSQVHLRGPRAPRLAVDLVVSLRDRLRLYEGIGPTRGPALVIGDHPIDDDMCDVHTARLKLPRNALEQP